MNIASPVATYQVERKRSFAPFQAYIPLDPFLKPEMTDNPVLAKPQIMLFGNKRLNMLHLDVVKSCDNPNFFTHHLLNLSTFDFLMFSNQFLLLIETTMLLPSNLL